MINVTKSYLPPRENLDRYIDRIYASGWMTNNGALVNELENRLKSMLGVDFLLPVANGTLALQVAFRVLGLKGSVVTTPFSFVATTSSLVWEHLQPIFADIDPETFNLDPAAALKAIRPDTSAFLPVHVFGNACEVAAFADLAEERGLRVVYDAAHAFGVFAGEESVLNYGDASILSFHATKIFHTIEGGAVIFRKEEDYHKARLMINFGISGYDRVDQLGINCKMNEFQAAMGLAVLDEFESLHQLRRLLWERYRLAFNGLQNIRLQKTGPLFENNFSYFPVVFESEEKMMEIRNRLNAADIFPRRYFYPSLNNLCYIGESQSCPVSESLASRILCLPLYAELDPADQQRIIHTITELL